MRHAVVVLAICATMSGAGLTGQSPATQQTASSPPVPGREDRGPHTGTAIIRGRVFAEVGGDRPAIANARVSLEPAGATEPVFTDGAGRFAFSDLPAGRYTLTAEKTGYAKTRYGASTELEPPFAMVVADASSVDSIEIRMPKGAAVMGRIVDDLGDPVVGAVVSAGVVQQTGSEERLVHTARQASTTDDRGQYRIGGLPPGRYYVSVDPASEGSPIFGMPSEWARTVGWGRTLYPAASLLLAASPIVLAAGEERGGLDFALAPLRSATLSMTLSDASGAPAGGLVNLVLVQDGLILANRAMPFDPGTPRRTITLDPGEWIALALIGHDVVGLTRVTLASGEDGSLALSPTRGSRLAGRVVFEGATAPPPPSSIRLEVREVGLYAAVPIPQKRPVTPKPDGSFELTNLFGAVQIEAVDPPRGWTIKAVMRGDRDLLDEPLPLDGGDELADLRIVLTDQLAQLSGVTIAPDGRLSAGCAVALFPDGGGFRFGSRRLRLLRADSNGRFVAPDLLAGNYLAVASPDIDAAIWQTSDYLSRLRSIAVPVTLIGGEPRTVSLTCTSTR